MPVLSKDAIKHIHNVVLKQMPLNESISLGKFTADEAEYIVNLIKNQNYDIAENNGFCFELNGEAAKDDHTRFRKIKYKW